MLDGMEWNDFFGELADSPQSYGGGGGGWTANPGEPFNLGSYDVYDFPQINTEYTIPGYIDWFNRPIEAQPYPYEPGTSAEYIDGYGADDSQDVPMITGEPGGIYVPIGTGNPRNRPSLSSGRPQQQQQRRPAQGQPKQSNMLLLLLLAAVVIYSVGRNSR